MPDNINISQLCHINVLQLARSMYWYACVLCLFTQTYGWLLAEHFSVGIVCSQMDHFDIPIPHGQSDSPISVLPITR